MNTLRVQRNATQRNATQRNATQALIMSYLKQFVYKNIWEKQACLRIFFVSRFAFLFCNQWLSEEHNKANPEKPVTE